MKCKVSSSLRSKLLRDRRGEQITCERRSNGAAGAGGQVNVFSSATRASTVTSSSFNRSIEPPSSSSSLTSRCTVVERLTSVNVAVNNEEINDDEVDYEEDDEDDEDEEEDEDDEFAEHTIFTSANSGTPQPLSSALKQSQGVYTNDSQENNDQDVNNLLERAARVRREFASGSSNSSLNSADAMILSLRRSTVDATSSTITNTDASTAAPTAAVAPGASSSLNLRSNYARFKAGVSFDSSSDINNCNVYHPLRRLSTLNNLKNQTGYNQSKSSSCLNYGTVIHLCMNDE